MDDAGLSPGDCPTLPEWSFADAVKGVPNEALTREYRNALRDALKTCEAALEDATPDAPVEAKPEDVDPSSQETDSDSCGHADIEADTKKKTRIIPFPTTPGFRKFWNLCFIAGKNANYSEIARETVGEMDSPEVTVETLLRTGRRYRNALSQAAVIQNIRLTQNLPPIRFIRTFLKLEHN